MSGWRQPDRWGMGLSLVCALHCLAIPLAFSLAPSLHLALHSFRDPLRPVAVGLLHLQRFDLHLVVFALGFAVVSLAFGWRRHRRLRAAFWLLPATVSFAIGLSARFPGGWHSLTLVLGGLFLMLAHARNLRDRQAVVACAAQLPRREATPASVSAE